MSAADIRGLRKVFGQGLDSVEAIGELDLSVDDGEFVSVLGAVRLWQVHPFVDHRRAGAADGRRGHGEGPQPALMFQESALFPWLNVRENVEAPLRFQGTARSERRDRAEELLALVRLERGGGTATARAVGRPATARRDGERPAYGRAVRCTRRHDARPAAR